MYSIPELPTDSLYKFISIFGLLVFIGGYISYFNVAQKALIEGTNNSIEQEKLNVILASTQDGVVELKDRIEVIKDNLDKKVITPKEKDSLVEVLQKEVNSIEVKTDEIQLKRIEIDNNRTLVLFYYERAKLAYDIAKISFFIGPSLAIFGFMKWYLNQQRYLDLIIKNQAVESMQKKRKLHR